LFYYGKLKDFDNCENESWKEDFIRIIQDKCTEKDCYICRNKVPEEGVVVRKESGFSFKAYKLKSFRFLEHETKLLDSGVSDLESLN
jgi:hypothetical protein